MSFAGAVTSGLQGALMLARGRAEGLLRVERGMDGAARSFWAIPLCMPALVFLRLITFAGQGTPSLSGEIILRDLLSFVVSWLSFAVISWHAARALHRTPRWPGFIAAWNWCNVVENLLLVAGSVPGLLGAPLLVDQTVQLVAMIWALWLEWYVVRLALDTRPLTAALLVILDEAITVVFAILLMPGR
jgi:hypothetical protein